jgi:hypothetical protein
MRKSIYANVGEILSDKTNVTIPASYFHPTPGQLAFYHLFHIFHKVTIHSTRSLCKLSCHSEDDILKITYSLDTTSCVHLHEEQNRHVHHRSSFQLVAPDQPTLAYEIRQQHQMNQVKLYHSNVQMNYYS